MFALKVLFKVFVILPIVAVAGFYAGGYVAGGGQLNIPAGVVTAVIASLAYVILDGKQEKAKFEKHARSQGINPEYVASYGENGIAIDRTARKVFAGKINKGNVFDFAEISSIEWEDYPVGQHMKYMIHINTKDFDLPKLSVGFASNRGVREEAYAKLRAALNMG